MQDIGVKMIIDAENLICGRFATVAAKKALQGENVDIINCEKAVITGERRAIIDKWKHYNSRGIQAKGPFIKKTPERFVRRMVRGMLGHRTEKGREAYKRIMCYVGVPPEFQDKKAVTFKEANISKVPNNKYITVGELTKEMKK